MAQTLHISILLFALILPALLTVPAGAAGTFVVAAADATAEVRAAADFVCDGIDDQLEINSAFAALPWDGGTVRLSTGTFHCCHRYGQTAGLFVCFKRGATYWIVGIRVGVCCVSRCKTLLSNYCGAWL
jgi:hypothetical protein